MSTRTKWVNLILSALFGIWSFGTSAAQAANGVTLYTPYTNIAVPPGQSIDYSVDVINNTSEVKNVAIAIEGIPGSWTYSVKSGGWTVSQISVLPHEKKTFSLNVNVPLKINKGSYHFRVVARGLATLPLTVTVSEKGTYKTEFSSDQPNMEGQSTSTFTFKANLQNRTADNQLYALRAEVARGWDVTFKAAYKQVTSVNVDANKAEDITIEVKAPEEIEAGKYKIPIIAETSSTSANLTLEVVITGSYKMELTTPTGLLSTDITAGDTRRVELLVRNTGSSALTGIKFSFAAPAKWDVTFDPKDVPQLEPGGETHVFATIKADKKAIPGDYQTDITAKTPEVSSKATFRISVETPLLWGWVGVLIILAAIGAVYYLFRKYGRR